MKTLGKGEASRDVSSNFDGRWITAGIVTAFFLILHVSATRTNPVTVWARIGVNHVTPSFADMRVITTGCETYRMGGDPLVSNPADPWHRPMNYPRIWLALCHLGLGPEHTAALAMALAAGFWAAMLLLVGRITVLQGLIYGVLLCSPPVMWAIERGNVDLLIFAPLAAAALLMDRAAGLYCYLLITAASILKLYPMWACAVALRERRRRGFHLLALSIGALAVYGYCIHTDISLNLRTTPQIRWMSYGRKVLFQQLVEMKLTVPVELCSSLAVAGSVLTAAIVGCIAKRPPFSLRGGTMAAIGAGMYVGTFVALNNFHYRMIFLLFLLPQLLDWVAEHNSSRWLGIACIVTIGSAMLLASSNHPAFLIVKDVLNWLVFIICLFILTRLFMDAWSTLVKPSTT